jgi:AcrR family transcriptional regulator
MPAAARTSRSAIIDTARAILEREGVEGLTMRSVAEAVGVRAPSLYKHVADRDDLVRLVLDATVVELGQRLQVVPDGAPQERLHSLADAFRSFGHERPAAFGLLFASVPDAWRADPAANAEAVRPVMETAAALVGPGHALDASRTLTAACVGFVTMELAGAFRLGGSVEGAWAYLLDTLVDGLGERDHASRARDGQRSSRR